MIDSASDIAGAVNRLLLEEELGPYSTPSITAMLGEGAATLLARAFQHRDRQPPADALERFRDHYDRICVDLTRPFPQIDQLVDTLAGRLSLAIATNKPGHPARRIVGSLGWSEHFGVVAGADDVSRRKPAPEHVLEVLDQLGSDPRSAVMIGDTPIDIHAGKSAGVKTIAVAWGYRPRAELMEHRPDFMADSVAELSFALSSFEWCS